MPKYTLPTRDALLKAMQVGETSIEAAEYMATRFEQILTKAKLLPECNDMLEKIKEYAQFVKFKLLSSAQVWCGQERPISDYQNTQENKAEFLASHLEGLPSGLKLEVAIGDDAKILRGFSSNGKMVEGDQLKTMDGLLEGWLAKNNLAISGGAVVKIDNTGNQTKVDPEEIRKLINDSEKGVAKYFADKGVSTEVVQRAYPETKAVETKREEIRQEIESGAEAPTTQSIR